MPLTNDTGHSVYVGPDEDGNYFTVEAGAEYELPKPPRTVSDDEAPVEAPSAPEQDLEPVEDHPEQDPPEPEAAHIDDQEGTPA